MRAILVLAQLALCFSLLSCATISQRKTEQQSQVVSLGHQFEEFWKISHGKPFEVQLENWNRIVEKPNQELFDIMVNNSKYDPKWEKHRIDRLRERFAFFEKHHRKIKKEFRRFDKVLEKNLADFKEQFPNVRTTMPIYAIPGATFNGKLGSYNKNGDLALAFGIDMMLMLKNNPDVLYAHEIFHLYHIEKMGLTAKYYERKARFSLPLWIEGLGTYVSEKMNPDASSSEILMQRDLARLDVQSDRDPKLVRKLASQYLELVDRKLGETDPEYIKRRAWFGAADIDNHGVERIGYLLGLIIARDLAQKFPLHEMFSWSPEVAHEQIKASLKELSKN